MSWQHHLFYAFPPLSLITRVLQKIQEEKATGLLLVPKWPTQLWWPKLMKMLIQLPVQLPRGRNTLFLPSNPQEPHPLNKKLSDSVSLVRRYLSGKGHSYHSHGTILKVGTKKQYATYLQKRRCYCRSRGIDSICPSVEDGINFLAKLYDSGIGYSDINTARSAVSSIVALPNSTSFGAHPMICRFLRGVFELKPSLPRYEDIWNVNAVLTYLSSLRLPQDLTLKDLTYKTTMLLALLSGQKCQTLHLLSVRGMVLKHDSCVFTIHKL